MNVFFCDFVLCPGHETSYVVCTAENQSATQARAFARSLARGASKAERPSPRKRISMTVYVDLDPLPGMFHTVESATTAVNAILLGSLPHYNPVVLKEN